MSDQVDEVKSKNDIAVIIGERIELKKAGSKYKALCPFHSEKTPSFIVSPELQIFKCFGCGKSGDVISFLEEYEGMDFYEALKYLAGRVGIDLKPPSGGQKGLKEKLYEINSFVARFYNYVLLKHPAGKEALNYITSERGLKMSTIEKFQVGFSPDQPFAIKKFIMEKKKISLKELEETGIVFIKDGNVFDRFRGRIIFPLMDHRGNIVGFAGRILPGERSRELAKYINTPETQIYHKSKVLFGLNYVRQEIKKKGEAIVVEGELDMISSWQAGVQNVVAIKGSALTEEQVRLLSRFAKSLVLALDSDFAGNEAARRGINISEKEGLSVKVAELGKYKDPDEAARSDPEEFEKILKSAVPVWDFIIDSVFKKYDGNSGEQKGKISKELVPLLASIEDKIVQAHYVALVAKKLQVPIEAVGEQISSLVKNKAGQRQKIEQELGLPVKIRRDVLEERLLAVIFRLDPGILENKQTSKIFATPFSKRILDHYLDFADKENFDISVFTEKLPKELTDGFVDLVLKDIDGLEEADEDHLKKEMLLIKKEIEILDIKQKLERFGVQIQNIENSGVNKENMGKIEREFTKLTKKLQKLD